MTWCAAHANPRPTLLTRHLPLAAQAGRHVWRNRAAPRDGDGRRRHPQLHNVLAGVPRPHSAPHQRLRGPDAVSLVAAAHSGCAGGPYLPPRGARPSPRQMRLRGCCLSCPVRTRAHAAAAPARLARSADSGRPSPPPPPHKQTHLRDRVVGCDNVVVCANAGRCPLQASAAALAGQATTPPPVARPPRLLVLILAEQQVACRVGSMAPCRHLCESVQAAQTCEACVSHDAGVQQHQEGSMPPRQHAAAPPKQALPHLPHPTRRHAAGRRRQTRPRRRHTCRGPGSRCASGCLPNGNTQSAP